MISIIIPVYNVKSYLARSVESILQNDTTDLELLLVDDGSSDGSEKLCDDYAAAHPDLIRVIHQKNQGPGCARNTAIAAARGEWFLFLDSDDRLAPDGIKRLREAMAREPADVYSFQFYKEALDGAATPQRSGETPDGVFTLAQHPEFLLSQPSCWLRLWNRSVFEKNDLLFPPVVWYEDIRTVTKLLACAEKIVNLPDCLYYYLDRPGSIMNSSQLPRNRDIMTAFDDILDWFRKNHLFDQYKNELCALTVQHVLLAASVRVSRIDCRSEVLQELYAYTEKAFPDWADNPYSKRLPRLKRVALSLVRRRRYRLLAFLFKLKG